MRISPQTLDRYIQRDGLRTHTHGDDVYVNSAQLRELWRFSATATRGASSAASFAFAFAFAHVGQVGL